jgi:hypothetical protein
MHRPKFHSGNYNITAVFETPAEAYRRCREIVYPLYIDFFFFVHIRYFEPIAFAANRRQTNNPPVNANPILADVLFSSRCLSNSNR